jgi:hypothetical protein
MNVRALVLDTELPRPTLHQRIHQARHRWPTSSAGWSIAVATWQCFAWFLTFVFGMLGFSSVDGSASRVRLDLSDPGIVPRDARRGYVLPGSGLVFSWEESERREWAVERDRVGRAGRWGSDEERYWQAIEEVWGEHGV